MKKSYILSLVLVGFIASAIVLGSCRKKADTTARVTVRDSLNRLVSGATVVLTAESTLPDSLKKPVAYGDTAKTNSSGVATFNFNDIYQLGQAGVAVLDIIASKGVYFGKGIIKIEEETDNEATVFLQ